MKLRPYQEKGEKDINEHWENHNSIMFQLVTGGGKTVIFVDIIRQFLKKNKRVILVAHREELINQAWKTLYKNKIFSGIIKGNQPTNYKLPCQVASIQTLSRRNKLPHADLVIFDEAHHCQDENSYGEVLKDHFPEAKVLGVTATPYRLSGHGFKEIFDTIIVSANYIDLRDDGFLVPYKYFVSSRPELEGLKISKGDYLNKDAEKAMEMAPLVESYMEYCPGMSGVVFAVNIHHSKKVVRQYEEAGISAAHIDAKTPSDLRKSILKRFKGGEIKVISNVGIITEGFDFPDMVFVQFARPTKSLSLYLQMAGRAFRVLDDVIYGVDSAEDRKSAISESKKPFAYILDNAGIWEEHGLPDQEFDWKMYFDGISSRKMKEAVEYIELIEFVAEDENGIRIKSKNPKEIEGLKLVEVNKQIRQRVLNVISLKEFDKLLVLAGRLKNVKKKGWFTFYKYQEYCKKNFIDMGEETWKYIIKHLYDEPHEEKKRALNYQEKTEQAIKEQYGHNSSEMSRLIDGLNVQTDKRIDKAMIFFVPLNALKQQREKFDREKSIVPKMPVKI